MNAHRASQWLDHSHALTRHGLYNMLRRYCTSMHTLRHLPEYFPNDKQELNRHLTNQKTEAERLLALREADAAQLQHELVAVQQAERSVPSALAIHHAHPGPQDGDWQMSISEAAANHSGKEPSDAAVQRLLEDRRKLQVVPCFLLFRRCHRRPHAANGRLEQQRDCCFCFMLSSRS